MEEVYRELVSDPAIRSTFFASLPSLSYSLKMSVPGSMVTPPGTPERSTDSQPDRRTVTFVTPTEPGTDRRRTPDRRSPPSEERELKAPKDRTPSPTMSYNSFGKGSGHDALMNETPFSHNASEVASARPAARSSQSPLPKQTDGGQPRTNKGKSKSGKSGKGKGNACYS